MGQTVRPGRRWNDHKWLTHNNPEQYIHRAMAKHGIDNFQLEVIATCRTQDDADEVERQLILRYDSRSVNMGYNISPGGDYAWNRGLPKEQQSMYGKKQSDYQKQRCSEVHLGWKNPHTKEWSEKVSAALMGHSTSDKTKEKISKALSGIQKSQDTKDKMSIAHVGKIHTKGTKKKMSLSHLGKKKSSKTKEKMSIAKRKFSIEQELEIVKIRQSGALLKELVIQFGCSEPTIISILKRLFH